METFSENDYGYFCDPSIIKTEVKPLTIPQYNYINYIYNDYPSYNSYHTNDSHNSYNSSDYDKTYKKDTYYNGELVLYVTFCTAVVIVVLYFF
jgi:hypothetical protein